MPYKSMAQERFAHTDTAKAKGFPTEEFDKASKGKKLPPKAAGSKKRSAKFAPPWMRDKDNDGK